MFRFAVCNFFWLKIIQNQLLSKYITSQCSKLVPYLNLIHNGKLVIMFLIWVVLVGFRGKYEFAFASLCHVCIHKGGVPDAAGGGSFEGSFFSVGQNKSGWYVTYLFRWHFPVKLIILVVLSRCSIGNSEVQYPPVRWLTAFSSTH